MILDIEKEAKEAADWEKGLSEEELTLQEIGDIAIQGLSYCPPDDNDFVCLSRKYSGESRCYCIRARFPTPDHYDLYLSARNQFEKYLATGMLAIAVGSPTETEKDK